MQVLASSYRGKERQIFSFSTLWSMETTSSDISSSAQLIWLSLSEMTELPVETPDN